jgi:hypothetical protein
MIINSFKSEISFTSKNVWFLNDWMALSQLLVRLHQSIAKRGKKISQKKK